ncbi:hypothetical protein L6164_008161 [Bauhinia variegata]|uniref:Uncharacterized protein n=1 Tax=Bauhinia variegata TaxID=167791 RepID=A0ACB9PLE0_BAUVA|nr:hypothetical protein L6164_008161 [Bauhinia variegata]
MVRKRRTEVPRGGESSETQEGGGSGQGPQRPGERSSPTQHVAGSGPSGGRGWGPQGGRGSYGTGRSGGVPRGEESSETQEGGGSGQGPLHLAERSSLPQHAAGGGPQGGRGWGPQGGRGSYGGGRSGGVPQQQYGAPSEYQGPQGGRGSYIWGRSGGLSQQHYGAPSEYQGRGRGGPSHRGGRGGGGGRGLGPSYGGPSRPPLPDLHQAAPVPYDQAGMTPQPASSEASSSSQPSEPSKVEEQFMQMTIQSESPAPPPASSKSMRLPLRPGKGSYGTGCIVKANHFFVELPSKDLHQYDVTITPEVTSRGVNCAVMEQLVRLYRESHLGKRLPAYDGRKSLYTAGPLPFISKEFRITLIDEDDGSGGNRREREFGVVIKLAARVDLHHLEQFLRGMQPDVPQEALQALDIVLRQLPNTRFCPVGRSFYSPDLGRRQPLGEGLESWRGFYQSIRPTQMGLSLNIDMSSTAFIEPLPVIDFVTQLLNRDVSTRPLSDADRVKIKKALRGVRVEVTHRGNMRRKYRISGLTSQATRELTFPVDERGTMKSVVEYFYEKYGFVIQHTQWPCLLVGNQQRPNYLPVEVCKIVEGQRYSKRLNERQITALLKVTCQYPLEREKDILQTVHHNAYHEDPYAKEFGIKISDKLARVEARILPAPRLKYHDTGREKDCLPQVGQWNMMNKKMVNGGTVNHWICINFSRSVQDGAASGFCYELAKMCNTSGMAFNLDPVLPPFHGHPDQVEKVLKTRYHDVMTTLRKKELDLLIVILPDNNGPLYGELKRICETDIGIVSQCCLTKHVYKMNRQYLANLALKINVKVGGRNTELVDALSRRIPLISDLPTIIFGADVTHPHPGEDSSPSIAAVVASQDWPQITQYAGLVCAQAHRQERIQDLYKQWQDPVKGTLTGGMIKELLISFRRATGQKPLRIIFYRDGVSEGQFYEVLLFELDAIRKACASLEPNYHPTVTFVVVQKRHHTRLFANNHRDRSSVDRSGNILPGTVVDSKICHPTEFDFYLCSHAGIQGTSRPAHYHVLWDENNFSADEIQSLSNNLCYTYARCTRSVSIVPPAYYAHLAAFRARFYMEPEPSDTGSMASGGATGRGGGMGGGSLSGPGRSTRAPANAAVRPLPPLKENVKRVMFYC